MDIRRARHRVWVGVFALGVSIANPAAAIDITINTTITSMTLTGTGLMPFGTGTDPNLNDGYVFVNSMVTATTSSSTASTGSTVLTVNMDLTNPLKPTLTVDTQSTFNFFLDLKFEDVDPANDYASGLASPFTLLADPAKPLTITLADSVTFSLADIIANPDVFPDDPGIIASSNTVARSLGVNINTAASTATDFIKYRAEDFQFGDDLTFGDDVISATDIEDIIDAIVLGQPVPLTFDAQVAILSGSFMFTGAVADNETDPPFSILLVGPSAPNAAPEPGTLALLGLALAALGFGIRSSRERIRRPV
jgi:hypothetical protein